MDNTVRPTAPPMAAAPRVPQPAAGKAHATHSCLLCDSHRLHLGVSFHVAAAAAWTCFIQCGRQCLWRAGGNRDQPEDAMCIICQDAEATCGFLHGSTVHKCACK
jgi:hypothetical protein